MDPEASSCDATEVTSFSPSRVYPLEYVRKTISVFGGSVTVLVQQPAKFVTSRSDLPMAHGQTYVAVAFFTNQNGDDKTVCSEPFTVDTTDPTVVGDIEHLDPLAPVPTVVSTHHASYLAARWPTAFLDADSNQAVPLDYSWRFHEAPVASPGPTYAAGVTQADTLSQFATVHGRRYYVTVVARNRAGRTTTLRTASPVLVDLTPPSTTAVRDGAAEGADVRFAQLVGATFAVNWDAMVEDFGDVTCVGQTVGAPPPLPGHSPCHGAAAGTRRHWASPLVWRHLSCTRLHPVARVLGRSPSPGHTR